MDVSFTARDSIWSAGDYDERLRLVKLLWQMSIKQSQLSDHADSVHIHLIGEGGESLGGSNSFAGSMIDVEK
ncbi:MAG: hypothetical protein NVSMB64_22890 [Candidatus Velthaea sp.]